MNGFKKSRKSSVFNYDMKDDEVNDSLEKLLLDSNVTKKIQTKKRVAKKYHDIMDLDMDFKDQQEIDEDFKVEESAEDEDILNWSKNKKIYYKKNEESDQEDEDCDDVNDIYEEAKKIQQLKKKQQQQEDFGDSFANILKIQENHQQYPDVYKSTPSNIIKCSNKEMLNHINSLSKSEKINLIKTDSPELLLLLESFSKTIKVLLEEIEPVMRFIHSKQTSSSHGLAYMEVKYHLLLNYCTNLSFYLALKAQGKNVREHPVLQQLAKNRKLLELMKPIDSDLEEQFNTLLKYIKSLDDSYDVSEESNQMETIQDVQNNEKSLSVAENAIEHLSPIQCDDKYSEDHSGFNDDDDEGDYEFETLNSSIKNESRRKKSDTFKLNHSKSLSEVSRDLTLEKSAQKESKKCELEKPNNDDSQFINNHVPLDTVRINSIIKLKKPKVDKDDESNYGETNKADPGNLISALSKIKSNYNEDIPDRETDITDYHSIEQEKIDKRRKINVDINNAIKSAQENYEKKMESEPSNSNQEKSLVDGGDDEYYPKRTRELSKREKKILEKTMKKRIAAVTNEMNPDGKRPISEEILKNRGLRKQRSASVSKNPRVRRKQKYSKALKKLNPIIHTKSTQDKVYSGESTGINVRVVRGVKLA